MTGERRRAAEWRVIRGDALDVLPGLPGGFAQTCVTSPPYWGLRDYGVGARVWGGEPGCRHAWGSGERGRRSDMLPAQASRSRGRIGTDERQARAGLEGGRFCRRCGAWRGCLGLEPDPELYVSHLVSILREVRRALRDDGTLWLVLGDSFAASRPRNENGSGLKPKDLMGIPWRVAFALQADGWWLRSDIVWAKPNPMPESVRDRPTRAHEYVFLLAKRRRYYYDPDAVREPDCGRAAGAGYLRPERLSYRDARGPRGQRSQWQPGAGRNRRSVWSVATQPFAGAHFATFPEGLVEPCVLAGTSPTACGECGAPWRRVVASERIDRRNGAAVQGGWTDPAEKLIRGRAPRPGARCVARRMTVGWEPGCDHADGSARGLVLDPFCGSGTTGAVSLRHGRDFLGVELNPEYARLARRRLAAAIDAERTEAA
jgi:DNA modification methylase